MLIARLITVDILYCFGHCQFVCSSLYMYATASRYFRFKAVLLRNVDMFLCQGFSTLPG